jgi:Protein of unknown function (DUF2752)
MATITFSLLYFFYPAYQYHFYPGCAWQSLTGLYCPACGSQRAFSELLHGRVRLAIQDNLLFVGLFLSAPLFLFFLFAGLLRRRLSSLPDRFWWSFLAIVVLFVIFRNLPGAAFECLRPAAEY